MVRMLATLMLLVSPAALSEPVKFAVARAPGAEVRFTIDSPLDQIVGVSTGMGGTATIDPATRQGTAQIWLDARSFTTGISLRDADLRDQFLEAAKYPRIVLTVQRFQDVSPNALTPGQGGTLTAVGSLSLHGVQRPVAVPLRLDTGEENGRKVVWARGALDVRFADYHIPRPKVLFLKLGDSAHVEVELTFMGPPPAAVAAVVPAALKEVPIKPVPLFEPGQFVPVAKVAQPKKPKKPRFQFAANTLEGRGERLLYDPTLGGKGNALACVNCHSTADEIERGDLSDGFVVPNRTLWDSAHRPALWQGISPTPGAASSLCVRLFMLNPAGLNKNQAAALDAYLNKISPDKVVPPLDYRVLALTRSTGLTNPTGGDRKLGAKLEHRYCESCHALGKIRPPLTVGLYEPDYLVRRVRWLDGKDDRQMPPFYIDRLPDSELRDIVTYLAGDKSKQIFQRKFASDLQDFSNLSN